MKAIVERHEGTVEKFIGDAVMAVFGVPAAHEDDALRAVRAAAEMRDALPELGVQARIGLNTGTVVTGTEERLATGDAVNLAARLEQAAEPGEVLLGEATLELVREAVQVEAVAPLRLKGKTDAVRAHRLLRVLEAPERRHETRFVGRERELALAHGAWERARSEQICELVTIVGRRRRGKDTPGRGGARVARGAGRARALPALRRGDHVLAGGRGAEPARRAAAGPRSGVGDSVAARGRRGRHVGGGDRLGLPQDTRARCCGAAIGRGLRRHPLGRGNVPRPRRARGAPLFRLAPPASLPGAAGTGRAPFDVADLPSPRAAAGTGSRAADPGNHRGLVARADRASGRRQPALHR